MGMGDLAKKVGSGFQSLKQSFNKVNRGGLPGGKQTGPNAFKHLKRGTGGAAGPALKPTQKRYNPK